MVGQTVHFDGTFDNFDNKMYVLRPCFRLDRHKFLSFSATQFVSNTSQDPLVIGPTETNSDLRIFNADGGLLFKDFANSNDHFLRTCQSLLERMVNTVPSSVKLSDPVVPIPVKPELVTLLWNNDTMQFSGQIRVSNTLCYVGSDIDDRRSRF